MVGHKNRKRKRNVSNYISLLCPSFFLFRFTNLSFLQQERAPLLLHSFFISFRSPTSCVVAVRLRQQCYSSRCDDGAGGKLEKASATFVQIINHLARRGLLLHMRVKDPSNKANRHFSFAVVMTCCSHRLQRPSSGKKKQPH